MAEGMRTLWLIGRDMGACDPKSSHITLLRTASFFVSTLAISVFNLYFYRRSSGSRLDSPSRTLPSHDRNGMDKNIDCSAKDKAEEQAVKSAATKSCTALVRMPVPWTRYFRSLLDHHVFIVPAILIYELLHEPHAR